MHIPALRKWCYPLIEGRQPEARPRRSVPLAARTEASVAGAAGSISGDDALTPNTVAIFLTGCTGYIGAHIASNLLADHSDPLNLLVRARDPRGSARAACGARCSSTWISRSSKTISIRASAFFGAI